MCLHLYAWVQNVSMCVQYISVCICGCMCVSASLSMQGAMVHPAYMQNFPGGQGKHSVFSCRPPWFEWEYVPLGQGWGTMVPVKWNAPVNALQQKTYRRQQSSFIPSLLLGNRFIATFIALSWFNVPVKKVIHQINPIYPICSTCRAEWVWWARQWLSHYGLLTVESWSTWDAAFWAWIWLVLSCGTRQGQGRAFRTVVALWENGNNKSVPEWWLSIQRDINNKQHGRSFSRRDTVRKTKRTMK